ncbi:MAG: type IV pilus assembly protein PilQ, partial [Gammaproteobacteria bacterium]
MKSVLYNNIMHKILKASLGIIMLLTFGANSAIGRSLVGLDYTILTGNAVQLVFTFDGAATEPRTFTIDQPAQISIDFANTSNKLPQRNYPMGIGNIQSIISASTKDRTRVVLNLTKKTTFSTKVSGNQMTLTLADPSQLNALIDKTQSQPVTNAP